MKITTVRLLAIDGGELAERLAHEPGLQADVRVADFAVEFLLGHEGGHRVDHDHVDRVRFDEHFGDLHRFFAAAGLADEQHLQIDAELLGPAGIEGVLGVDHRGNAAGLLGLGSDVQSERRLAARLGSEDLDDAAARQASAAEGDVERQAAGRDALDRQQLIAGQRHDRAFAKLLFDRGDRVAQLGAGFQNAVGLFALLGRLLRNLCRLWPYDYLYLWQFGWLGGD